MSVRESIPYTAVRERIDTESLLGFITISPTLAVILAAVIIPGAYALAASFHQIDAFDPVWQPTGIGNYLAVFSSPGFYNAFGNGVVFTVGSIVVQLFLGIAVALLVHDFKNRVVTAVTISLYVIPSAVVAVVFERMLTQRVGVLHNVLEATGLIAGSTSIWAESELAMLGVILVGSYKFAIFVTIMILARLQSIPTYYYEAATMAGATKLDKFVDITLPQLKGVIALVVLLRAIWMFNNFDIIWILTQGGPSGSTETLPIYAFKITFSELQYGMGSTIAMVMFLILAIGGVAYLGLFNPEQDVEGSY
ncbi:carbohydrate ABC transporter permease [Salinigranum halophilum]|uniref:carbohydrate ABC transporter permease n=1 Tax=Salinigranum halophilum TaxID=2565931 RepID=UPI0013757F56|nr:sugar ABC transporter permease [Salinigranum halophilum]